MIEIKENVTLAPHTTFKIGGLAEYFVAVSTLDELQQALAFAEERLLPIFILGSGSNVVVSDYGIKGLVVKIEFKGKEIVSETGDEILLKVAAGESWDGVVKYAVDNQWWGIENLSHIPGSAGAVAVQNVGAYGQEASQVVKSVECVPTVMPGKGPLSRSKEVQNSGPQIKFGMTQIFSNTVCRFSYRSSIFNTTKKGKSIITAVTFKLSKTPKPNLTYGDVKKYFEDKSVANPSIQEIQQAITEIRDRKFPFPAGAVNGNAGSFFKAYTIPETEYDNLIATVKNNFGDAAMGRLKDIKDRLTVAQGVKVPYGYLVEMCELKGKQFGNVQVCPTHAGVLVNASGSATAKDVLEAFRRVRRIVHQKTGVVLQNEPELVGFNKDELDYYFEL